MSSNRTVHGTALLVTLLCISCIGVLVGGLDYFATVWGERALEYFGALPTGWGLQHVAAVTWTAVGTTAVLCAPLAVIIYRNAVDVERALAQTGGASFDPRD